MHCSSLWKVCYPDMKPPFRAFELYLSVLSENFLFFSKKKIEKQYQQETGQKPSFLSGDWMKNIFSGLLGQVVFFSHPSFINGEKVKVEWTNLNSSGCQSRFLVITNTQKGKRDIIQVGKSFHPDYIYFLQSSNQ